MSLISPIRLLLKKKDGGVWSIGPDATVYEGVELLASKGIGALLVIADGKLVGILSERDYARKVILQGRGSKDTKVKEIMTSPVIFVTPKETVDQCMALMTHHRIRHLPVVEGDAIVGVISIGDLVKWLVSEQEQQIQHLENYITGKYPG